jgi:uroporphyrinogen decarboxylase
VALTERENYLRNARFQGPDWIPAVVSISGASRAQLGRELEEVLVRHPTLFPNFVPGQIDYSTYDFGPAHRASEYFTDAWGCIWHSEVDGLEGVVVNAPLADWEALETFVPPDPLVQWDRGPADWEGARRQLEEARAAGRVAAGSLPHGFLFMRLYYLRGFENFMMDVATDDPRLQRLIDILLEQNMRYLRQWLELGVDVMHFGDDLGTQKATLISPAKFGRYVTPAYKTLIDAIHEAGALVALHSDGHIMEFMDEFAKAGVDIINPQDLLNGIDNLAREVKGRMCIRLDIDRQTVVPWGTRQEIYELIEEEVRKLGSPAGGLEFICGIYPPTPPENVDAVCSALEDFRTYWWDGRADRA